MTRPGLDRLLERESELAHVSDALDRGDGGAVIAIEGAPGIGKSGLLAATRRLAADAGFRVLAARGRELEREFSHGVVRHLLEPVVGRASVEVREKLLAGAAGHAGALFEPARTAGSEDAEDPFALLHGLFWLTANIAAEGPLLLAVDDLHWCDQPSLRFIDYLGQRLEGLPIVLAATLRPNEPGADPLLLESFASGPLATRLQPKPLTEAASAELVRAALARDADAAFCRACHAASGGNPLLLRELARALCAEGLEPTADEADRVLALGSRAVSRTVALRLARLGPPVAFFAQAAAVLGDGAPLRLVAQLAEVDDETAYEAVGILSQLDIVRPERTVEFVHPLVRAAVYAGLRPGELERAHARAARVLADAGAPPERVAAHLLLVPPAQDHQTVAILRDAARRSLHAGDGRAATAHLRRALEEPPRRQDRGDVLFELGSAEALTDGQAAVVHLGEALALADDATRRATTAERLSRALFMSGRVEEAVAVSERVIADVGASHPELGRRLEAALLAATLDDPALAHVAAAVARRAGDAHEREDYGAKALAALVAWRDARALAVSAAAAAERARRALEGGVLLAEDAGGILPLVAADVLAMAESESALRAYDAAVSVAQERGSVLAFGAATTLRSRAQLRRGALADALADAQEGVRASTAYGVAISGPMPSAFLADALMERGELDAAQRALDRARPGPERAGSWHWLWYRDSVARLLVLRGDPRRGLAETLECGRRLEAMGARNPAFMAWRSRAALCLAELGEDAARARRLVDEEVELAEAWGAPRPRGAALRAAGLVTGGTEGLGLLRRAVEVLDGSPARLELARALTDLGAALRRANRRAEAREPLRRGLDLAHRCGSPPLEQRAREELRATGARPRRAVVSGVSSLTPSEQRVARMAAEGSTNRDIAQKLFVTPKTVEIHLSHAYRKLDVRSRSELPRALATRA